MTREVSRDEYTVCDQCRSRKIRCSREKPSCRNCTRLGIQCEWSGQGKKRNQTTLLSHTILGMGSRLQHLENTIADTQRSLKRLFDGQWVTPPNSARHSSSPPGQRPQFSPEQSADTLETTDFGPPLGRFLLGHNNDERYFGSTSLESLMLKIKDDMTDGCDSESHTFKECISQAQWKIDLLVKQGEGECAKDTLPPTTPPFAILDAMIEPYFSSINPHFPIWTKEKFIGMATTLRQSPSSERDFASIICCNNLILMAMSADSLCSNRGESTQNRQGTKVSSMEFDMIAGFRANAKRAIQNIDQLLLPRLINVQALLSLYMVAQEHFSIVESERLFALASRCAKLTGIHQWHSFQGHLSDEDIRERQTISYCLYTIDKTVCWTTGLSPNIPASDIHFETHAVSSEVSLASSLIAKSELAKIEETIYSEIYASQVKPKREDKIRDFAAMMLSKLQVWLTNSGIDLNMIQNPPETSADKLQLTIRYLNVQLLLIWPHKHHPDTIYQRCKEVARMCMKLVLSLWNSPPDEGKHAVFPSFVASLPPLYLYEVLSSILSNKDSKSDFSMLQDYIDMLEAITAGRSEDSYNNLLSPLGSGYGYIGSELKEIDSSGFDNSVFQEPGASFALQDPDTSFVFLNSLNSTTVDPAPGSDDFMPHLRIFS
ncbi:transcriptional regulator family: Fungal Specific TF [Paecilomyces variotii]|nr:transcriptional regulator family: Fungal Specific TF [Paecilomyces variotii]KAJ9283627.1 transcriptional regulator family: Fungal Specific TF [Paecilomyces variotii]KAJ9322641.1 transcriptional regulator family: Fungal Specific TF [Paecilomyces variotii]KAJ9328425.1 transcriptional regulator family: Fungal Specific TF [Paecilomyces variotii]KAJ9398705.1 transcriptional regulator family: Fungal Specific TF [Paecilomyces variotii]